MGVMLSLMSPPTLPPHTSSVKGVRGPAFPKGLLYLALGYGWLQCLSPGGGGAAGAGAGCTLSVPFASFKAR